MNVLWKVVCIVVSPIRVDRFDSYLILQDGMSGQRLDDIGFLFSKTHFDKNVA